MELVVCIQPQVDHITGLVEVLQRCRVKQVLEPGVSYDSSVYQEWCNLVDGKQLKRDTAKAGQELDLGSLVKITWATLHLYLLASRCSQL